MTWVIDMWFGIGTDTEAKISRKKKPVAAASLLRGNTESDSIPNGCPVSDHIYACARVHHEYKGRTV